MNFNTNYQFTKDLFEKELYAFIDKLSLSDEVLIEAIKYSVKAGGKRIRPVLMIETAKLLGVSVEDIMPFAISIELIHTYSLIHDDLPAMDNDDYRRGKLTNHKVYGEAMAILAGDALLNLAYETMLRASLSINKMNATRLISRFAGYTGMIGGQATDVRYEGKPLDEEVLKFIHANKTGKLLTASVLAPSCIAGDVYIENLRQYGENLGMLFQVTDDILDATSTTDVLGKTVLKDAKSNKLTFVSLNGVDKAKQLAVNYYNNAINSIKNVSGNDFLLGLAEYVLQRKS